MSSTPGMAASEVGLALHLIQRASRTRQGYHLLKASSTESFSSFNLHRGNAEGVCFILKGRGSVHLSLGPPEQVAETLLWGPRRPKKEDSEAIAAGFAQAKDTLSQRAVADILGVSERTIRPDEVSTIRYFETVAEAWKIAGGLRSL